VDETLTFEYPDCGLRRGARVFARMLPPLRPLATLAWPAARRADHVELSRDGIRARSFSGYARIGWDEVLAVHRARTTWGRMTVHIVAKNPGRQIEITESMPGFDELVRTLLANVGVGEIVHLSTSRRAA
jgi:predicted SPOUT superfamily RNA methylase MTH1